MLCIQPHHTIQLFTHAIIKKTSIDISVISYELSAFYLRIPGYRSWKKETYCRFFFRPQGLIPKATHPALLLIFPLILLFTLTFQLALSDRFFFNRMKHFNEI